MIEYYPWSKSVLHESMSAYDKGGLPALDLELTAKCTKASCIYCDSRPDVGRRHPNELSFRETKKLITQARDMGLKWVYSCGLGEPLEDTKFRKLVELLYRFDVRLSVFTNGILIDNEDTAKWLHDHGVCLLLKLDTFDEAKFDEILGAKGRARRIYDALDHLLHAGYGRMEGDWTDLGLSIVPTQLSYDGIEAVVLFAKENNIFPSIGELEQAGRVLDNNHYAELALTVEQTETLKNRVDELLWLDYKRPICPVIVAGIHIDHVGNCVVDLETGLNCKWFLLSEPLPRILGNVRQDNVLDLYAKAIEYRRRCFENNGEGVRSCASIDYVFGGCGGNPREVIDLARKHIPVRPLIEPETHTIW